VAEMVLESRVLYFMKKIHLLPLLLVFFTVCSCSNKNNPIERTDIQMREAFLKGEATLEDFCVLFTSEKDLLESIANQFWSPESNLRSVSLLSDELTFRDRQGNLVVVTSSFREKVSEYFKIVGSKQGPSVRESNIAGYRTIQFSFWLPESVEAGLIYSPEGNHNWKNLEDDWYIFSYGMV
jgi:hypothetical protein